MPVIDGLPVPEPLRQIAPRAPGPGPEEDPVDHLPVIGPPATARRISGQEPPQAIPLLISQIMAIQQIKHRTDLHDPAVKIHGTRSSGLPGLPGGPVTCGLLAGDCAGDEVAGRFVLDVLAPVQPARMAQVSVAKVSVRNNGRLRI